jgi:hypothetical protein
VLGYRHDDNAGLTLTTRLAFVARSTRRSHHRSRVSLRLSFLMPKLYYNNSNNSNSSQQSPPTSVEDSPYRMRARPDWQPAQQGVMIYMPAPRVSLRDTEVSLSRLSVTTDADAG